MDSSLEVNNLTKMYPGHTGNAAVDNVSFRVRPGEIIGLLGPNGSGKSTTIQMLLGTLSVTSGSIRYFGRDFILYRSEALQHISYASSYTSLPWVLSVEENLRIAGLLYGLSPRVSHRLFMPLLERFGLLDKRHERVSALSAGQITRLMLVKAFFVQPKVILLDEPTASLDPDIANEVCSFIMEQRDIRGVSIIFTSHKMHESARVCDRVVFLKNGRVVADETPHKLVQNAFFSTIRFRVVEGLPIVMTMLSQSSIAYTSLNDSVTVIIPDKEVQRFFERLQGCHGCIYDTMTITAPSLEDFFLHVLQDK